MGWSIFVTFSIFEHWKYRHNFLENILQMYRNRMKWNIISGVMARYICYIYEIMSLKFLKICRIVATNLWVKWHIPMIGRDTPQRIYRELRRKAEKARFSLPTGLSGEPKKTTHSRQATIIVHYTHFEDLWLKFFLILLLL